MAILKRQKDDDSDQVRNPGWYLEGLAGDGKSWIIAIKPFPFLIGRQEGCHLRLSASQVSRQHAMIFQQEGELWMKELGSTNGTFVNRQRLVGETVLHDGDILHFGNVEFRVSCKETARGDSEEHELTQIAPTDLPQSFFGCELEFGEMLRQHAVVPHFQPIVRLSDQQVVGYELLGRGDFEGVPTSPPALLRIARRLGKEIELSELFRRAGVQRAKLLGEGYHLFFNTVPAEMKLRHLQFSLRELRGQAPTLPLAMEIHEAAVTDLMMMKKLRALLNELNIQMVYDDFGAGQARLVELITVPPDYLKFDITLIRNIHLQPLAAQKALQALVYIAGDLGVKTLAEGVEIPEEVEACVKMGFDFAQGYYFGKPGPHFQHE